MIVFGKRETERERHEQPGWFSLIPSLWPEALLNAAVPLSFNLSHMFDVAASNFRFSLLQHS